MIGFGRKKTGAILFFATLIALAAPALAAAPSADNASSGASMFARASRPPDIGTIPLLSNLVRAGAKLYYIGERSNLHGWFIVKDGQIQIVYVTADGQTAIVGGMFTGNGENVTGAQIQTLSEVNKEVGQLLQESGLQQGEVAKAGAVAGGAASVPGDAAAGAHGGATAAGVPGVTLSPGERLMQDLEAAAGVTLGHNDKAEIMMVMDPNCPYCRATWKEFRDSVSGNRVQIKMIPITLNVDSDNTRAAARLLAADNPFDAWDRYVNGDKTALDGKADDIHLRAVLANRDLADRWNIRTTPYLVYRGRDGRVKIVQGEPKRIAAVLSDLIH
jgi:protein-disulfide isomerase